MRRLEGTTLRDGIEEGTDTGEALKYSEVLSALSFVLDMVEGQPEGHVVRSCYIGMKIAEHVGLPAGERSELFYALLLKDAGCSSNASEVTALFGSDDFRAKRAFKTVNWSRLPDAVFYAARSVSPEGSIWSRVRRFVSIAKAGPGAGRELVRLRCERGAEISRLMGFPEGTARAIRALDEHWDGAGHPDGLRGEEIPLAARICGLAQTVEVFYSAHGPVRAEEIASARRKRWFDPDLVDAFLSQARRGRIWGALAAVDLARSIWKLEPPERTIVATPERLDLTALAFARIIDAKSPFTYRHSEGVAATAAAVSGHMGFSPLAVRDQTRAGLLHDIGKLAISNAILDKPGKLTGAEFTQVKKHTGITYEVVKRVAPFRGIVEVAASHHEKLDGSGYHRGLSAKDLSPQARILAVADIFDALSQERPYRPAMPMEKVLSILERERDDNKLCPEPVAALTEMVEKGKLRRHAGSAGEPAEKPSAPRRARMRRRRTA